MRLSHLVLDISRDSIKIITDIATLILYYRSIEDPDGTRSPSLFSEREPDITTDITTLLQALLILLLYYS